MKSIQSSILKSSLLLAVLVMIGVQDASAQFEFRWMTVGSLQSPYSEGGVLREQEPFDNAPSQFPAIDWRAGNYRAQGLWVGTKNFTDENGENFPHKVAHIGPRSGGEVQFFPTQLEVISKYDPEVLVDGAKSFQRFVFIDEIDPGLDADRMIHIVNNNRVGIEMDLKIRAWSQEYHDSYHMLEYNFTNTGNVDSDPEIELSAPLTDVYFFFISRYALSDGASWVTGNGAPWGKFTMNDAVGDGHEDYEVDFRAQYAWFGWSIFQNEFNALGGPMWAEHWTSAPVPDTTGRLAAAHMVGRIYIHADKSASDESDDPEQPRTMGVKGSDEPDLVDDEFDKELMFRQFRDFIELGRQYPHHADLIVPSGEFDKQNADPAAAFGIYDEGGWATVEGFGPYEMAIGENVRLVIAESAGGLSDDAKSEIGIAYRNNLKFNGGGEDDLIEYNGTSMTKNQWVMTARDSLFQVMERARANFQSNYAIPAPPAPPTRFEVTSGPDKISLTWDASDAGGIQGWEVWRASRMFQDPTGYELVATLDAGARSYDDAAVQRGIEYYYYLQAVGATNSNSTGLTPTGVPLKSGRYYTQTYLPATLKRPAGNLEAMRVVPNPFNLASDMEIRWPDKQDKLGFLDIPGQCTIRIYSQLGELIDTIEHTDGSGDEFWDHTTSSRQVVSSGIYIAVIEDTETGERVTRKFTIIR